MELGKFSQQKNCKELGSGNCSVSAQQMNGVEHFFSDFPKCDILLNNDWEVFNKCIFAYVVANCYHYCTNLYVSSTPFVLNYKSL